MVAMSRLVRRADVALLGLSGFWSPELKKYFLESRLEVSTQQEEGDDVRQMLGGFWLAIGVIQVVALLLIGQWLPVFEVDWLVVVISLIAALPCSISVFHLVFPGGFPILAEKLDQSALGDIAWLIDLVAATSGMWLAFRR